MNLNSHSDIGLSDIYCDDHLIINFDFADTAVLLVCVGNKTIPVVYGCKDVRCPPIFLLYNLINVGWL